MCMTWTDPPQDYPNTFVSRYALDKLLCAHTYLMETGRIWYNPATREADAFICIAMSNIRKEWRDLMTR